MGMGRSGQRGLAVLVIAGLGLVLTACGGDDDDAAPAATDGGGDNADENDNGDNNDNGDTGDTIKVDDIDDIPDECIDLMGDLLQRIEPMVEDVDWENADLSELSSIGEDLNTEFSGMDAEMESAGCNQYQLEDADSMDALIDIAKDKAPGTVAYLEFIKNLSADFSAGEVDTGGDNGDNGDGGDAGDVPQDCDGAIGYMEDLMGQYDHMADMTLNDLTAMSNANQVITTQCSLQQMNDFFQRNDVQEWMSGT